MEFEWDSADVSDAAGFFGEEAVFAFGREDDEDAVVTEVLQVGDA